ncbi:MAG: DUF927 domain-containing protein [Deltaproteobacteria bacterium]|nr:DUF927 domain-containing protein [Deltaproteobacteria bacterium]
MSEPKSLESPLESLGVSGSVGPEVVMNSDDHEIDLTATESLKRDAPPTEPSNAMTGSTPAEPVLRRSAASGNQDWPRVDGYEVGNNGVWHLGRDGDPKRDFVASGGVTLDAAGTDESGAEWVRIRWKARRAGEIRSRMVPRQFVLTSEVATLIGEGLPIVGGGQARLVTYLARRELDTPTVGVQARLGWSRDFGSFALGSRVHDGSPTLGYVVGPHDPAWLGAFGPHGDREEYLRIVREAISTRPVAEFAWALGYTGPLLRLVGSRGFLVSIWGQSGFGKTAVQMLASSAWGRPSGLMVTGNVTATALEATLARHSDLLAIIDDTQQSHERDDVLGAIAYQIAGGKGRARGTVTGGIQPLAEWATIALVSGERPILLAGSHSGALNRTVEIQAKPLPDSETAKQLHRDLAAHHGHTGSEFIKVLLASRDEWGDIRTLHERIVVDLGERSELGRNVGLVVVADWIARARILSEQPDAARDAALRMGRSIVGLAKATPTIDPAMLAWETLVAMPVRYPEAFGKEDPRERFGWCHSDAGRDYVIVLPDVARRALREAGIRDPTAVWPTLCHRGLLLAGEGDRPDRKVPAKFDPKRTRAYWIVPEGPTVPVQSQATGTDKHE